FTLQGVGGSIQSASAPPGWTCVSTDDHSTCSVASFPTGTATFTFTVSVLVNFKGGTLTQRAAANTPIEWSYWDNTATTTTTIMIPPQTPVSLDLTASPDNATTGETLTYTVNLTNTGSVDARNLSLTLQVPQSILTTTCGTADNLACSFPTLAAGATQTVTVTVQILAAPGTPLTASASLQGANLLNGYPTTSLTTTVHATPHADLQARMTAPPSIKAGDQGVWTFFVSDAGPDAVSDWTLTSKLPAGVTFAGGMTVTGQATCNALPAHTPNVTLTCRGTSLPFRVDLPLAVDPSATGAIHATATVTSSDVNDPNPDNNSASADTLIQPPARRRAARH
ncbi:MAG TPA: CARDB domain-containing protein, partial [Thermoanaerobaculia bacterium]|nr:CARDB domain-containing protein [Thermoanaerobaculia bacterium]